MSIRSVTGVMAMYRSARGLRWMSGGGESSAYGQVGKFERKGRSKEEEQILAYAHANIPHLGFTKQNVALACEVAGYSPLTYAALLPRGEMDLVEYHLDMGRKHLKDTVVDLRRGSPKLGSDTNPSSRLWSELGTGEKVRDAIRIRLNFNEPVAHRLDQAIGVMARPQYVGRSLNHLGLLVDDIWYLSGDTSSDFDWYTKRATLGMIYTSAEVFMVQDRSQNFKNTYQFLDRRLEGLQSTMKTSRDVLDFFAFNFRGLVNTVRSKT